MRYVNRRKAKYYGSIFITSLAIITLALVALYTFENTQNKYHARLSELHEIEKSVPTIQYSFKLQVQEWKNILLRGNTPELYDRYYESFTEQFLVTQTLADELSEHVNEGENVHLLINEFLLVHRRILLDYQQALTILRESGFDSRTADIRVRGIDREPDKLLTQLRTLVNAEVAVKRQQLNQQFEGLKVSLAFGFISGQGILCILLVRLTGRLLRSDLSDKVTECGNRNLFMESLKEVIDRGESALVAIIDIDEFKIVNETCGNKGGDNYLKNISLQACQTIGKHDLVCRISGDILGLIIFDKEDAAKELIKQINHNICQYVFVHADIKLSLSSSSSSYWIEGTNDNTSESVLSNLFVCLQMAKTRGNKQLIHYDKEDHESMFLQKCLRMVHTIPSIIDNRKAVLFRQAITPIDNVKTAPYYEVLLRIESSPEQFDSPYLFLETAERFHLIGNVDRYVVKSVIEYVLNTPEDNANYSINLSGKTMSDATFVSFLDQVLSPQHVPSHRFIFEITETEIIKNFTTALQIINCLTQHHCKISLDDFGTGMASYAYISKLSVNTIKIDGTFIKDIDKHKQQMAIVRSIVLLAKELHINTVAEFVETEEELSELKQLGIDYAQGYLLHKPALLYRPVLT